jgi:hypothetical protein
MPSLDQLTASATQIATMLRTRKPNGDLALTDDEATKLVVQLAKTAHTAGIADGVSQSGERMLQVFDAALAAQIKGGPSNG